ncbi:uncharacterized protein [Centruroides vittatus]|uniref:uncharacterized protein n=1 Tax=Centruroides vittatus TaxID=120091 RepID=UPI0035100776
MRLISTLSVLLLVGTVSLGSPTEERSDTNENSGYVLALPVNDDEPIAEESQARSATEVPPEQSNNLPEPKKSSETDSSEAEEPVVVILKDDESTTEKQEEKEKENKDSNKSEEVTTETPQPSQTTEKSQSGFRRPKFDEIAKILGLPHPSKPKPIPPEKPKLFSPFVKALPRLPTPFGSIPFPLPLRREGSRLLPDLLHVATSLIKRALIEETFQNINKDDKDDDDDDDDDGPMVLPIPVPTLRKPSIMLRPLPPPPRPRPIPIPVPVPHPSYMMNHITRMRPVPQMRPVPSYIPLPAQPISRTLHVPHMLQSLPPPPPMMPLRPLRHSPIMHPMMHPVPQMHHPSPFHLPVRPPPTPFRIHPALRPQTSSLHPVILLFTPVPVPVPVPVHHHPRRIHIPAPTTPREEVIFVQQPMALHPRESYEPKATEQEMVLLYPEPTQPRPVMVPQVPKPLYNKPQLPSPKLKLLREILMAKHALKPNVPYGTHPVSSALPLVRQIKMLQVIQHRFFPFLRSRA